MRVCCINLFRVVAVCALLLMACQSPSAVLAQTPAPTYPPNQPQQPNGQPDAAVNLAGNFIGDAPIETLPGPLPFQNRGLGNGLHYQRTYGVTKQPYPSTGQADYLNQPAGLAMNRMAGNLYVVERNGHRLWGMKTTGQTGEPMPWAPMGVPGVQAGWAEDPATPFANPQSVLVDPNGYLWVGSWNWITIINPGAPVGQKLVANLSNFDQNGINFSQNSFDCISGLALDASTTPWQLYVAERCGHNNALLVLTVENPYQPQPTVKLQAVLDPQMGNWNSNHILFIDNGSMDRVFVGFDDNGMGGIMAFGKDAEGNWTVLETFSQQGWNVRGLAVKPDDPNYLYAALNGNNGPGIYRCSMYQMDCTLWIAGSVWNPYTYTNTEYLSDPQDLLFDAGHYLYVADSNRMTVQRYDTDDISLPPTVFFGTPYIPYASPNQPGPDGDYYFNNPQGLGTDANNNLFVLESNGQRLTKFSPAGAVLWTYGMPGQAGGRWDNLDRLNWPEGSVAVGSNNLVYVPDRNNNRVLILNGSTGESMGTISSQSDPRYSFECPAGVAINTAGDIFVMDNCAHTVTVYDSNRFYRARIGVQYQNGSDNQHFWNPRAITLMDDNTLLVADAENARIQKCTRAVQSAPQISQSGVTAYAEAWTCSTFAGSIYGRTNDINGAFFDNVDALAWDAARGLLYVGEEWTNQIKVFNAEGENIFSFGERNRGGGGDPDHLGQISALTLDGQGGLYVADRSSSVVYKYLPTGAPTNVAGVLGGVMNTLASDGSTLYTNMGARLAVFGTSNPQVPNLLGLGDVLPAPVRDLKVSGQLAYLLTADNTLSVYNVQDKAHPYKTGSVPLIGPQALAASGSLAFTVTCCGFGMGWNGPRIEAIDASDPTHPESVSFFNINELSAPYDTNVESMQVFAQPGGWYDIYLAAHEAGLIKIGYDSNSKLFGNLQVYGGNQGLRYFNLALSADGNMLYALDQINNDGAGHLKVFKSVSLLLISSYDQDQGAGRLFELGENLYHSNWMRLYAYPANDLSTRLLEYNAQSILRFEHLAMANGTLYDVAGPLGLQALTVTLGANPDASSLTWLSRYKAPAAYPDSITQAGGYLYASSQEAGTSRFNISSPSQVVEDWQGGVGGYDAFAQSIDNHPYVFNMLRYQDNQAYIAVTDGLTNAPLTDTLSVTHGIFNNNSLRLSVRQAGPGHALMILAGACMLCAYEQLIDTVLFDVDFSIPSSPVISVISTINLDINEWGSYPTFYDVGLKRYVLIPTTGNNSGVRVLDITDPLSPQSLGNIPSNPTDIQVLNGRAYVTNADQNRLQIFDLAGGDLTDPGNMPDLGSYYYNGWVGRVTVQQMGAKVYAYISAYGEGFLILDVTDPSAIKRVDLIQDFGLNPFMSVAQGNFVYTALGRTGIYTYWVSHSNEASLDQIGSTLDSSAIDGVTYTRTGGQPFALLHMPLFPGSVPALPNAISSAGHAFATYAYNPQTYLSIESAGTQAYTLSVDYTNAEITGLNEGSLALYYWDGQAWVKEPTAQVNLVTNQITASPNHFSLWALGGSSGFSCYLPVLKR